MISLPWALSIVSARCRGSHCAWIALLSPRCWLPNCLLQTQKKQLPPAVRHFRGRHVENSGTLSQRFPLAHCQSQCHVSNASRVGVWLHRRDGTSEKLNSWGLRRSNDSSAKMVCATWRQRAASYRLRRSSATFGGWRAANSTARGQLTDRRDGFLFGGDAAFPLKRLRTVAVPPDRARPTIGQTGNKPIWREVAPTCRWCCARSRK